MEQNEDTGTTWAVVATPAGKYVGKLHSPVTQECYVFSELFEFMCEMRLKETPNGLSVDKAALCSRIDQTTDPVQVRIRVEGSTLYYLHDLSPGDQQAYMYLVKQARMLSANAKKARSPIITQG